MHTRIECIYRVFPQNEFSNVSPNFRPEQMQSHIDCICRIFLLLALPCQLSRFQEGAHAGENHELLNVNLRLILYTWTLTFLIVYIITYDKVKWKPIPFWQLVGIWQVGTCYDFDQFLCHYHMFDWTLKKRKINELSQNFMTIPF